MENPTPTTEDEQKQWLLDNAEWLNVWLTNVCPGRPGKYQKFLHAKTYSRLAHDLKAAEDEALSAAAAATRAEILWQAVFGQQGTMVTSTGEMYKCGGFIERYGRLPTPSDEGYLELLEPVRFKVGAGLATVMCYGKFFFTPHSPDKPDTDGTHEESDIPSL